MSQMWLLVVLSVVFSLTSAQQEWTKWTRDDHHWAPWDNYDPSVVVRTYYGDVRGFSIPWHTDDLDWDIDRPDWEEEYPPWFIRRINCFLGIPYALPPLGPYRLMRPKKPRWGGTWEANRYRPACPQHLMEIQKDIPSFTHANISEDCLYMNIFAPNITWHSRATLYPVVVWIHGGDFVTGSAQTYPGHVLATREVVVVTFNYRLGALGFLTTNDVYSPGNWGLFDQHMAIEFVKENIKAFKGDPDQITLAGDGAGAASVGIHLVSPLTKRKKFFHQTVMMSGSDQSMFGWLNPYWKPKKYAQQLAKMLNCDPNDMYVLVECLRDNITLPWLTIVDAQHEIKPVDGDLGVVWGPTQDAQWYHNYPYLPQTPHDYRLMNDFDKLPGIIGLNTMDGAKKANETLPSLADGQLTRDELREFLYKFLEDQDIQPQYYDRVVEAIEFQYTWWPEPANDTARAQEFINMLTDLLVGQPMDVVLKQQALYEPQYMYKFNYHSPNDWVPRWMGPSHKGAVPFIFGFPFFNETVLNETFVELRNYYDYDDRNMSDWMMYLWTNFARYGRPTVNETRNITWEPFNFNNLSFLVIDDHSHIWGRYRQNKYSFWGDYFPSIAKQQPYFATPTPQGYGYVISTGSLSAVLIMLLCGVGMLIFLMWLHSKKERDREKMADSSIPLSFYPGSVTPSEASSMNRTPEKVPYTVPQPRNSAIESTQMQHPQTKGYPGHRPSHYPQSAYRNPGAHDPPQDELERSIAGSSLYYPTFSSKGYLPGYQSASSRGGYGYGPPGSRSGSESDSYPYSDNEFSKTPSVDITHDKQYPPPRRPRGPPPQPPTAHPSQQSRTIGHVMAAPRRKHVPQHSVI